MKLLTSSEDPAFRPLFNGSTLAGWHPEARIYGSIYPGGPDMNARIAAAGRIPPVDPHLHPAIWAVEDEAIVGRQGTPSYGGYLVSDETFGDFELVVEAKHDWPADTGIMLRRKFQDWTGFQVLFDHRESGSIGGFFGNGLASFNAVPFALRSVRDSAGKITGLTSDDPASSIEPVTQDKIDLLSYAAKVEEFLDVWKWAEWNEMRIRCVGALPVITTWVNGLKVAEIDTRTISVPNYDPDAVLAYLGPRGHIALEVHDNDAFFGDSRWAPNACCRWRNIRIKTLD